MNPTSPTPTSPTTSPERSQLLGAPPPSEPPARQPQRNASLALRVLLGVLALCLAAVLGALGWLVMWYPEHEGPGRGKLIEIVVTEQATVAQLAQQLGDEGALAEPELWALYASIRGAEARLKRGTILLYDDFTPQQVLQRLAHGYGPVALRIVVPEGYTRFDLAERLERFGICERERFLRATEDRKLLDELGIASASAEGWLFPDTYSMLEGSAPRAIVRRMVRTARARFEPLLREHAAAASELQRELGLGPTQLLTLASIVEEEAAVADERAIIAGVFLNRLRDPSFRPKRLQADPTVSYGCRMLPSLPGCAGFDGQRITKAMLADAQNPYNTYRIEGLPPGPICNPGLASLRAVLAPARHDYLYFVARGAGRHAFSATLDAHNAAVVDARSPQ